MNPIKTEPDITVKTVRNRIGISSHAGIEYEISSVLFNDVLTGV